MSRLPDLDPATLTPAQARFYQAIVTGRRGSIRGPFTPWLRSPEFAFRAQHLGAYLRFDSALPPRLSELAILTTARFWRARFEWYAHAPMARAGGLAESVIEAIRLGREPVFTAPDEAAVHAFAAQLHLRHEVSDPVWDHALEVLGEPGVVDLIGLLGYYTLVSMTLNACRVPLPPGEPDPFPDASVEGDGGDGDGKGSGKGGAAATGA